jgi:hypothetical protein
MWGKEVRRTEKGAAVHGEKRGPTNQFNIDWYLKKKENLIKI